MGAGVQKPHRAPEAAATVAAPPNSEGARAQIKTTEEALLA